MAKNSALWAATMAFLSAFLLSPVTQLVEDNTTLESIWISPVSSAIVALIVYYVVKRLKD